MHSPRQLFPNVQVAERLFRHATGLHIVLNHDRTDDTTCAVFTLEGHVAECDIDPQEFLQEAMEAFRQLPKLSEGGEL